LLKIEVSIKLGLNSPIWENKGAGFGLEIWAQTRSVIKNWKKNPNNKNDPISHIGHLHVGQYISQYRVISAHVSTNWHDS